jgi:hypothetical protein
MARLVPAPVQPGYFRFFKSMIALRRSHPPSRNRVWREDIDRYAPRSVSTRSEQIRRAIRKLSMTGLAAPRVQPLLIAQQPPAGTAATEIVCFLENRQSLSGYQLPGIIPNPKSFLTASAQSCLMR